MSIPIANYPVTNYIANVFLPVSIFNLNESSLARLTTFKECPLCNMASSINVLTSTTSTTSTTTSSINNPNLTNFGNFFLKLIVNEFNTTFGTDYTYNDFSINSAESDNDQNSRCTYILTNITNNFQITCYAEIGDQVGISMRFDYGDYSFTTTSTTTSTVA